MSSRHLFCGVLFTLFCVCNAHSSAVITTGGLYQHRTWNNNGESGPALQIQAHDPVTLDHCVIISTADGIESWGANLKVTNCTFVYNGAPGDPTQYSGAIVSWKPSALYVYNNSFNGPDYGVLAMGDGSVNQAPIYIEENISTNQYGFCAIQKIQSDPNIVISWNEITQPCNSNTATDRINIYDSSGTAATWMYIGDNYISGNISAPQFSVPSQAFPAAAAIQVLDGSGAVTANGVVGSSFVQVCFNIIINCTSNSGIAATGYGGFARIHDNSVLGMPSGPFFSAGCVQELSTTYQVTWANNYVGSVPLDFWPLSIAPGNTPLPAGAVTWAAEQNQLALFIQAAASSGIALGP